MKVTRKDLVGRTIVGYEPQLFSDGRGGKAHNPVITLDNGVKLFFVVEETDAGRYGVQIERTARPKPFVIEETGKEVE